MFYKEFEIHQNWMNVFLDWLDICIKKTQMLFLVIFARRDALYIYEQQGSNGKDNGR